MSGKFGELEAFEDCREAVAYEEEAWVSIAELSFYEWWEIYPELRWYNIPAEVPQKIDWKKGSKKI